MPDRPRVAPSPSPSRPRRPGIRGVLALLAVAALVGVLAALVLGPRARLGDERTGDPALAADTARRTGEGPGLRSLSVARIENGAVTFAGLGDPDRPDGVDGAPTPDTVYELGSVTKTWTGMLLADAVRRGEMSLDAPVETYLPELAGSATGRLTPRQLATHTAGLPSVPEGKTASRLWSLVTNANPYAPWTRDAVLAAARETTPENVGAYAYSNLGMSLLGHAEARAAGAPDWPALTRARLLDPLGMTATTVGTPAPEPGSLARPHLANGFPTAPWSSDGFAPAGVQTRTTARDLARFAAAVLDGRAPGADALTPLVDTGDATRVGLAWHTTHEAGSTYTWHNGGTGGTSTMLALDPATRRAALVLGDTATGVEDVGTGLLGIGDGTLEAPRLTLPGVTGLVVALLFLWSGSRRALRVDDRVGLATAAVDGLLAAGFVWVHGPLDVLPGWVLGALVGAAAVPVGLALARLPGAAAWPARRAAPLASLALSVALAVLLALAF